MVNQGYYYIFNDKEALKKDIILRFTDKKNYLNLLLYVKECFISPLVFIVFVLKLIKRNSSYKLFLTKTEM